MSCCDATQLVYTRRPRPAPNNALTTKHVTPPSFHQLLVITTARTSRIPPRNTPDIPSWPEKYPALLPLCAGRKTHPAAVVSRQ